MSVEIPQAFVAYVEERGGEVHVEEYSAWEDDDGEWHPAGEVIWMRKDKVVRDKVYVQAVTVNEDVFAYPDRWEMFFDLLELGLETTIRRGEAHLN